MAGAPLSVLVPDRLYLGALQNAQDHAQLRSVGITHAINMAAYSHPDVLAGAPSVSTLSVKIPDHPSSDIEQHFAAAYEFATQVTRCLA